MFNRELNNANTVKRMADFLGHHLRIMKKIILILAAMLTFAACTKEGDVIYQTDPADALSATLFPPRRGVVIWRTPSLSESAMTCGLAAT